MLDLEEQIGAGGGGGGGPYTGITGVPTGTIFYRKSGGTGAAETQSLATLKTDLGLTGTNSGDQTNITGNAGTATALQTPRNINGVAFDGTGNITINAVDSTARLAASAVSAFGLTLIDDADAAAARATLNAQVAGSYLTGNQSITLSGDASGSGATAITVTLATVNSNTGTFGGAASVAQISVNGKGLITGVTAVPIAAPWADISGKPAAVTSLTGTNTGDETKATIDTKLGATGGTDFYRKDGTWATPAGGGGGLALPTLYRLTANHSNSTTTPSTIGNAGGNTPWTHTLVAGNTYYIRVFGLYQSGTAATGGRMNLLGAGGLAGTVSGMMWGGIVQAAAASTLEGPIYSFANGAGAFLLTTGVSPINAPHIWGAEFVFHCTTGGTLSLQWASETAVATQLNSGSIMMVQLLN